MKKILPILASLLIFAASIGTVSAEAATYRDSDSGVSFTLSPGWTQDTTYKSDGNIDAKFVCDDSTHFLLFSSQDIWSAMPEDEKAGMVRADINNSMFTAADVGSMLGADPPLASTAYYGGRAYFSVTTTTFVPFEVGNKSGNILTMTILVHFNNGWMYMFQFNDSSTSEAYTEVEQMLESVQGIKEPETETVTPNLPASSPNYSSSKISFDSFIISLLYTVVVYFLPVVIYRYGIRRYPMTKKAARTFSMVYMIVAFFCSVLIQAIWLGPSTTANTIPWLWGFINYRMLVTPSSGDIKKVHVEGFSKKYVYIESERDRLFEGVSEDILQGCKKLQHNKKDLYNYLNELIATGELWEQGASILYQEYTTHAQMGTLPVYTKKEEATDPEAALPASEDGQRDITPTEKSVDCPVAETAVKDEPNENSEDGGNEESNQPEEKQDVVFCRHCGEEIPEGNAFCHKCGTQVIEDQADSIIQYCRFCGANLEKESVFCGKCGIKIREV